ncbi:MAG: PilZ domain-containing protein [Phycisphaerales bacterium]
MNAISTKGGRNCDTLEVTDGRNAARYVMGGAVACNLGRVLNLSTSGALVVARSPRVDGNLPFQIGDGSTTLRCEGHVVRTRRLGQHRYECAIRFGELTEEQSNIIARLVRDHRTLNGQPVRQAA